MSQTNYNHELAWPIHNLKAGQTVLGKFPDLAADPVLKEHGQDDQLLRFAIFFAGRGTGLHGLSLDRRKEEALRLAGYEPADPRAADILAWRYRPAVLVVNEIIRHSNDIDYVIWFHTWLGLLDSAEQVSARIDAALDLPAPPADSEEGGTLATALAQAAAKATGMDEDKRMRTYTLRHKLIDDLNRQRKDFKALTLELFLTDEQLAEAAQRAKLSQASAVGQRAAEQSFVPHKKTIG